MKSIISFLFVAVLIACISTGFACHCRRKTLKQTLSSSSNVLFIRAKPFATFTDSDHRYYIVRLEKVYMGCPKSKHILIKTNLQSMACGVTIDIGTSYLLELSNEPIPSFSLCSVSLEFQYAIFSRKRFEKTDACNSIYLYWKKIVMRGSNLTDADKELLYSRSNNSCVEDINCPQSDIFYCIVSPCQNAQPPCPEATKCRDNYCGGCNAKWYTDIGIPACKSPGELFLWSKICTWSSWMMESCLS